MENLLLIILCLFLGFLFRKCGLVGDKARDGINVIIIHMSLPALALYYAHSFQPRMELLYLSLMAWIVFFLGYGFFSLVGRFMHLPQKTVVCLSLTAGLGQTSFMGLPMIEFFYGREYIGAGMVCDLGGTFLAFAIPGIILAARATGSRLGFKAVFLKVMTFPPFLAVIAGIALHSTTYPEWLSSVLRDLGGTLTPLALLSVGMSIRLGKVGSVARELSIGLAYKLIMAPAFIFFLYLVVLGRTDMVTRVAVFEAAMPPVITGGIIAMSYGLNPTLAASLMGVGTFLAFLTLPAWFFLIRLF